MSNQFGCLSFIFNFNFLFFSIGFVYLPVQDRLNFETREIQPIQWKRSWSDESLIGLPATVSGWGIMSDETGELSDVLRTADTIIINNADCSQPPWDNILPSHICVLSTYGEGSCRGKNYSFI